MLQRLLLVCCVACCVTQGRCCNRKLREAADIVQAKFRDELREADCGEDGDPCKWDRDCCDGYECSLGAGGAGLGLYCRAGAAPGPPPQASGATDVEAEGMAADGRAEDDGGQSGAWMTAGGRSEEGSPERTRKRTQSADVLEELERLRESKKEALARENAELERLFTAREERELEQLRALKADAEMEELRRLKELRLKRKLELIRELKELRRMRDEAQLDDMEEAKRNKGGAEVEEEEVVEEGDEEGAALERANVTSTASTDVVATEGTTKRVRQGIKGNKTHRRKHQKKGHERNATLVEEVMNATTAAAIPNE